MKAKCLLTNQALWVNFEKRIPIKGAKSNLVKQKIKKILIEKEIQVFQPIIFVNNQLYERIKEKAKQQKIGKINEIMIELNLSDILTKSNFSILKEKLLKEFS